MNEKDLDWRLQVIQYGANSSRELKLTRNYLNFMKSWLVLKAPDTMVIMALTSVLTEELDI